MSPSLKGKHGDHSAVKVTHFLELVTVTFPKKELVTGKSYTLLFQKNYFNIFVTS